MRMIEYAEYMGKCGEGEKWSAMARCGGKKRSNARRGARFGCKMWCSLVACRVSRQGDVSPSGGGECVEGVAEERWFLMNLRACDSCSWHFNPS